MSTVALAPSVSDHAAANQLLAESNPREIIEWALEHAERPLLTTSFGAQAGVLIHAVLSVDPSVPVVWVDHGFNTNATYRFAKQLIKRFNPNLEVYAPKHTSAWILSQLGGVPDIEDPNHAAFTQQVKLEPFNRALSEMAPDVWFAGIRADETAHRRSLDVVTEGRPGITRVAPFFRYSEAQMEDYLSQNEIPVETNYFDPTKGLSNRECGLHAPT